METLTLEEATEIAREGLTLFGISSDTPISLLKRRENAVFLVEGTDDYVLRVHRRGYHSDAELGCELDFVTALNNQNVAVPQFLPTVEGKSFALVGADRAVGEHQLDLQLFLPNTGNFGDEREAVAGTATQTPADFTELGKLIGQVHDATATSGYEMAVPRDDWDIEGLVGAEPAWGDPLRMATLDDAGRELLVRAIASIREDLEAYGLPAHRFGPIHADLTPENVLRTTTGLRVIDFDDFAAGWHLFDLATAIYFFGPHPRYAEYSEALFAGYESVRPLDAADREAFPAILLARGLTYMGWAADRPGEPTADWHATVVLPHLLALAERFLRERAQRA